MVGRTRGGVRGERRTRRKKRVKITKRRLVHIFSVKTAAAESGCGETGGGKGGTMVIFRLIFYVCPARLPTPYTLTRYAHPLPLFLPFSFPPRVLPLSFFICLLEFWVGSIDYRQVITKSGEKRRNDASLSRVPFGRDTNNLSRIEFPSVTISRLRGARKNSDRLDDNANSSRSSRYIYVVQAIAL